MARPVNAEFRPGLDQVASRFESLPEEYRDQAFLEISEYALDVLKNDQPKYKYVSRAEAYPDADYLPGWFSQRQHRYVMGKISSGEIVIPYRRTGALAEAWNLSKTDETYVFSNPSPAAQWAYGEKQARQLALVGWKKLSRIVAGAFTFRSSKFRNAVAEAYQRAIRKIPIK